MFSRYKWEEVDAESNYYSLVPLHKWEVIFDYLWDGTEYWNGFFAVHITTTK